MQVSAALSRIPIGKGGVAFLVEQHAGISNILVASSSHAEDQITNALSCENSTLGNVTHSGLANSMGSWYMHGDCAPLMYARRVLSYDDLHCYVWISVPHVDFWGFVKAPDYVSAACTAFIFLCLGLLIYKAAKLRSLTKQEGWAKIAKPVSFVFVIMGFQVIMW